MSFVHILLTMCEMDQLEKCLTFVCSNPLCLKAEMFVLDKTDFIYRQTKKRMKQTLAYYFKIWENI